MNTEEPKQSSQKGDKKSHLSKMDDYEEDAKEKLGSNSASVARGC